MEQHQIRMMGILNTGLSGNRLLHDLLGPNALARFDRDVLNQTGVTHVIILVGNNDVGVGWEGGIDRSNSVTSDQVIQGYIQLIERAHTSGLRIYGGTLPPFQGAGLDNGLGDFYPYFSPENEAKRQTINAWIRASGAFDGVIDFDAALRDPNDVARMLPAFDSGDHLHPNDAGYKALADAVNLTLLQQR
jgi:lysophospholipase L1-like esterase